MRYGMMRHAMRFYAMMVVLMALAVAAYSQSRVRSSSRAQNRSDRQQGQMMMSGQPGQPDFARRMAERHARNMQEMQQDMEQMRRQAEENRNRSIQQALRASDDQWRRLRPVLDRIERLKTEAEVSAGPNSTNSMNSVNTFGNGNFQGQTMTFGGGFAGGSGGGMGGFGGGAPVDILDSNSPPSTRSSNWSGAWTSSPKSVMEMTEGEILCQELQQLLQGQSVPSAEVSQKVAALRRARAQARENLAQARQSLRGLMLPQQEPALVMMGYLD